MESDLDISLDTKKNVVKVKVPQMYKGCGGIDFDYDRDEETGHIILKAKHKMPEGEDNTQDLKKDFDATSRVTSCLNKKNYYGFNEDGEVQQNVGVRSQENHVAGPKTLEIPLRDQDKGRKLSVSFASPKKNRISDPEQDKFQDGGAYKTRFGKENPEGSFKDMKGKGCFNIEKATENGVAIGGYQAVEDELSRLTCSFFGARKNFWDEVGVNPQNLDYLQEAVTKNFEDQQNKLGKAYLRKLAGLMDEINRSNDSDELPGLTKKFVKSMGNFKRYFMDPVKKEMESLISKLKDSKNPDEQEQIKKRLGELRKKMGVFQKKFEGTGYEKMMEKLRHSELEKERNKIHESYVLSAQYGNIGFGSKDDKDEERVSLGQAKTNSSRIMTTFRKSSNLATKVYKMRMGTGVYSTEFRKGAQKFQYRKSDFIRRYYFQEMKYQTYCQNNYAGGMNNASLCRHYFNPQARQLRLQKLVTAVRFYDKKIVDQREKYLQYRAEEKKGVALKKGAKKKEKELQAKAKVDSVILNEDYYSLDPWDVPFDQRESKVSEKSSTLSKNTSLFKGGQNQSLPNLEGGRFTLYGYQDAQGNIHQSINGIPITPQNIEQLKSQMKKGN